jgi:hypothetical protein
MAGPREDQQGLRHRSMRCPALGLGDVVAVWVLWAVLLVVMFITYARLPVDELYNVSRDGIGGGLSRVLVQVNFPIALVAIAIALLTMDVLPRAAWALAAPALVLCAMTGWPGVVDQGDLDARAVNALPAAGVALVAGLSILAARPVGSRPAARRPGDIVRLVTGVAVVLLALPYLAAEAGVYLPDVVFITGRKVVGTDGVAHVAVHHGHHHGLDGALLVLSALVLSRHRVRGAGLRRASSAYLGLMLAYGAMVFAQDSWNEQLVKRGTVTWQIPEATEPRLHPVWLVILAVAAGLAVVLHREQQRKALDDAR